MISPERIAAARDDDHEYTSLEEAIRDVLGDRPEPRGPFRWDVPMEDRPNFYLDVRREGR